MVLSIVDAHAAATHAVAVARIIALSPTVTNSVAITIAVSITVSITVSIAVSILVTVADIVVTAVDATAPPVLALKTHQHELCALTRCGNGCG